MMTKMPTYDLFGYFRSCANRCGRGSFNFNGYVDGLFDVLQKVNTPTVEKTPIPQSYSGRTYNFDAAHADIRNAATEAFYDMEQNRFILRPLPTNATAFQSHGQFQITQRGQEWATVSSRRPKTTTVT